MAKFETLCCAMMWGLANALLVAVAIGTADPFDRSSTAQIAEAVHPAPSVRA